MIRKRKFGFYLSFLAFFGFLIFNCSPAFASSLDCKMYKKYEKEYNNKTDKKYYLRIREIKNKEYSLYLKYRDTYEKYKKYDKKILRKLSQETQKVFKVYKSYKGYKDFRYYEAKCKGEDPIAYSYILVYTAGTGGTISGEKNQTLNEGENGTTVTAVPSAGYRFVNWSDGVSTASRTDMNVSTSITVTANFEVDVTSLSYSLRYTVGTGGTLSGNTNQTVKYGESGSAVTATADSGYRFVRWSDGNLSATRTDTGVTADISVSAVFEAIYSYTLTYTAGTGGTISGTTPQTISFGGSGSAVTAVPNTGYHFVSWSDGVLTASRTDSDVSGNILVSATFAINTYTLTYAAGSNGAISGTSPQTVNYGSDGSAVTAVPNTGYHFTSWSDGVLTAARTDTNVSGNISVTASFAINTYTLSYAAATGGTISGTASQTINHGSSGSAVTAVASTGYTFSSWSDGVLTAARTDTNVTGNISVTASFVANSYTLTYTAGSNGSITGTSPQTVSHGNSGTQVTAVPATGYHFTSWSDGVLTAARTDTNVTGNISVTASFAIDTHTLAYTAGAHGTITGTNPQTINYGADGTEVTAVPNTGYHFVQWSDDVMTASRTDLDVTADISVTATFAINSYTLTYTAGSNGSITGTSPQTVNYGSSGTQVTAVADSGYHFTSWSDGVLTAARTDANVTGNISVTASFAVDATYTLTYTAGLNGSITGTSPQTVSYGGNGTQVTAVADSGYHFTSWSDGVLTAARTDTNITGNVSVTASFAVNGVVDISAINPSSGYNYGAVNLTSISGSNFLSGITVKLTKTGQSDITCTGFTVASSTSITGGSCNISGAATGTWNVVVTNTDTGTDTLTDGFMVLNGSYSLRDVGPAGGWIFYINPNYATDGWKYLEAAPADQSASTVKWADDTSTAIGGTGTAIGTGLSNTNIMKSAITSASPVNSALELVSSYSYNGYSDWFLPSSLELVELSTNLTPNATYGLGTSGYTSYWSSSEVSGTNAYRKSLSSAPASATKVTAYGVRVARRF